MISHKIFELLSNLDRKEMTRFREFADSPYHNKHRDVRALTEYLSRIFPQFNERNCRRETIWNAVAPDRPYDFAQLALLFTYTRRLLDDFLMQEQFWRQPDQQNLFLLSELRRRNLFDLYEKKLRQTVPHTPDNGTAALSRYLLAAEADAYFTRAERRRNDESLQQKANLLDAFYLAEKLRDACEMQVRRHILKVDYSSRLLDAVLREADKNPFLLDSPRPRISLRDYHKHELRFRMLTSTHPEEAERMLQLGQDQVLRRFAEYEQMASRSADMFAADAR